MPNMSLQAIIGQAGVSCRTEQCSLSCRDGTCSNGSCILLGETCNDHIVGHSRLLNLFCSRISNSKSSLNPQKNRQLKALLRFNAG